MRALCYICATQAPVQAEPRQCLQGARRAFVSRPWRAFCVTPCNAYKPCKILLRVGPLAGAGLHNKLIFKASVKWDLRFYYTSCYFYAMQRSAHPPDKFTAVYDSRRQRVRGLWRRGRRYYAQMRVDTGNGASQPKRIPLAAETLDAARAELEEKRTANRKGELHAPGRRPSFAVLVAEYLKGAECAGKSPNTQRRERFALSRWVAEFGGMRVDWIKPGHLAAWRDRRRAGGVKPQVINLDLVAFSNAMKYAQDRSWIAAVPRLKRLKPAPQAQRRLLSPGDIARLLGACRPDVTKHADLLRFYLRFLALSGARKGEALRTRWVDIDFGNQQVIIGADGGAKGGKARRLNCTPELEALLRDMHENGRQPDSAYLFPAPRRGARDVPAGAPERPFAAVRRAAGLPAVGFHDFRHFFASQCVMAGIDFMTIASWLGHRDGGVLVGKVYGHLSDDHKSRMAAGLTLLAPPRMPPAE
jgi:integrase